MCVWGVVKEAFGGLLNASAALLGALIGLLALVPFIVRLFRTNLKVTSQKVYCHREDTPAGGFFICCKPDSRHECS